MDLKHNCSMSFMKLPFSTLAPCPLVLDTLLITQSLSHTHTRLKELLPSSKRNVHRHFTLDATWLWDIDFHVLSLRWVMHTAAVCKTEEKIEFVCVFCQKACLSVCLPVFSTAACSFATPPSSLTLTPVSRLFKWSRVSPAHRSQWKSFRGPWLMKWAAEGGG